MVWVMSKMHSDSTHGMGMHVECISPHIRIRTCEMAFVIRSVYTRGETDGDMFVGAAALHVWE